jgi:putative flippase GtrA
MTTLTEPRPATRRAFDLLARMHEEVLGRFAIVSLVSLVTGHILLYGIHVWMGQDPVPSNIASTAINTVLVFFANRRWVWNVQDRVSFRREVVPFGLLALLGLAVSTLLVWITAETIGEGLWVNLANIVGFGLVWIARFFLLDRWVYGTQA